MNLQTNNGQSGARFPILGTLRKCLVMLPASMRWRWALLTPAAFLTGMIEGGAAAAVFALIKIISDPSQIAQVPVASTIAAALPWQGVRAQVLALTGLVALYYLLKNLLVMGMHYLRHKIVGESVAALKGTVLSAYLGAPYPFHARRNSADLIWNADSAVDTVCNEAMSSAIAVVSEILTTLSITAVLLIMAPKVTLIAGGMLVVVLALLMRLTRRAAERFGTEKERLAKATLQTVQEALGGIKEIKALGREAFFQRAFDEKQQSILRLGYLGKTLEAIGPLVTETVFVCGALIVIALVTGGADIRGEGLPILALFSYAAFRIVPSTNRIAWRMNQIRGAGRAAADLYDDYSLIRETGRRHETPSAGDGPAFHDRIELENVCYAYPEAADPVLRDVSLTIRCGESIGVVGATGAGKSTLVDLVAGLLLPSSGRITVDGSDLAEKLPWWRRRIGYVPQTIFLIDDSIRRNIAFGIPDVDVDERRVKAALCMAQLDRFVATLPQGLETPAGERGIRLSGGERQRVGIARALYHEPDLIVFDEATSALDNATEADLATAIEALHGQKTLLVVAHRLSTVRNCDRLVFISGGRIQAVGSYDELLRDIPDFRRIATAGEKPPNSS